MADGSSVRLDDSSSQPLFFVPKRKGNEQIKRIEQHFGSVEAADIRLPKRGRIVFLCFTPRCGSTFLAQLIAAGGDYNLPREYLNFDHVIKRSEKKQFENFGEYFADLIRADTKSGHVFIKITPYHLGLLDEAGLLGRILGRSDFVLIERGDKLAQAISHAIARRTGKYTSNMQSRRSESELVYDRKVILQFLKQLADAYKQFDMFFGFNGITPVHVVYEQLVADPAAALKLISDRLDLPEFALRQEKVRNARQANDVNATWRRLFLSGEGIEVAAS